MAPRPDSIVKALGKLTAKGHQGLAQALQAELSEGGACKEQNGGKIPSKNLLSQFMPQAPVGTDPYMLPDWGASRWDEGGNYPIIDWVIALVLEENKQTPLSPNTDQAWLTQPSLKALFHLIWSKLKQQFKAEHNMAKKSRKDKWLLEGRLTEHRNTVLGQQAD
ncbi:hypothetical protein DACRYDRAFT_107830 [Dacryopinax primogenitus]|uniref:Uncharacterized protein n=1 Tax=Dacryopinax primogenitus (strain DJM 731) TaxID=1858805 RepID=M5GBB3_DACPD|nr:uncharacterized protein DACRYDRAFT_107830 [Dacryopinax primogenitus]EJU01273.1 hypothetical protein DACRYDRAFT_107830 [Dacryopinax primogenitus]